MQTPIAIICDRCRAEGVPGDPSFDHLGALLDFDPVPRLKTRVDGWDADTQRWFVAALAATGSVRRAAAAVGRAPYGADQLRNAPGGEGFALACDEAMALAAEKEGHQRAARFEAATRYDKAAGLHPGPWAGSGRGGGAPARSDRHGEPDRAHHGGAAAQAEDDSEEARLAWLAGIVGKYLLKLGQERKSRLAGEIVAADFYLRQLTQLEVMLDLMATGGFFALMRALRAREHDMVDIAETPVSRLLDAARRQKWAELGDPPRPAPPARDLLVDHGAYSTEPTEATYGGRPLSHEEQWARFAERHAEDAAAQIKWEAEARRDYERRRDSDAAS